MNFEKLVTDIQYTSQHLQQNASKAVNIHLTLRNWIVGFFIIEFEQNGKDKSVYGSNLLNNLAEKINIKGLSAPELSRCRQFYKTYPQIIDLLAQEFNNLLPEKIQDVFTDKNGYIENFGMLSQDFEQNTNEISILGIPSQELNKKTLETHTLTILTSFSYSHFVELTKINDPIKRKFYELLILKTTPTISELKRQISTLAFERVGLSKNTEVAFEDLKQKITPASFADVTKSHYFFDFLKLPNVGLIEESDLEQALINHLQAFIIELGNGFCFEARQKRILIGDEYFFIDLVFYHRILKCHILVELKTENVKHEHIGQLKTYINYYKKNFQEDTDNPPVGILLVTDQNKALVEYAVADSDQDLFVSKYLLQLPKKEQLEEFINNELKNK
jgi:predicted nuclease of restriction endonuclease-like (RecB) superfamily